MPVLEDLDPEALVALIDHVARLKHDLGKYVALRARWLGPEAPLAERRAALEADLLSTRRGPAGTQDAVSVWRSFRPQLVGAAPLEGDHWIDLSSDPDVQAIERAMLIVEEVAEALSAGKAPPDEVGRGEDAAREVAEAIRRLHARVREQEVAWPTS